MGLADDLIKPKSGKLFLLIIIASSRLTKSVKVKIQVSGYGLASANARVKIVGSRFTELICA